MPQHESESEGAIEKDTTAESAKPEDNGALTSLPQPLQGSNAGPVGSEPVHEPPVPDEADQTAESDISRSAEGHGTENSLASAAPRSGPKQPPEMISFNAESVTAQPTGPNEGNLRFRLVKDRHDVRFNGYLFVYVEMVDSHGESEMYTYPGARKGEDHLPTDFREGESVKFRRYTTVELPYGDIRPDATLSGVSILLYGKNGDIVFQRGFNQQEVKVVDAGKSNVNGASSRRGERRRAL